MTRLTANSSYPDDVITAHHPLAFYHTIEFSAQLAYILLSANTSKPCPK